MSDFIAAFLKLVEWNENEKEQGSCEGLPVRAKQLPDRDRPGLLGVKDQGHFQFDCYHKETRLDHECRMGRCIKCEAYIDPFDILVQMVQEHEGIKSMNKQYEKDNQRLSDRKYQLEKELRSLDGKIKRRKENLRG